MDMIPEGTAADFFSEIQPVNSGHQTPVQNVQQVPQQNQQQVPQGLSPEEIALLEHEVNSELQKQIQVNENVDALLEELLHDNNEGPKQEQIINTEKSLDNGKQIDNDKINEQNKNLSDKDVDDALTIEEQNELLDMLEDLKHDTELDKIEMQSQIEQLSFRNDLLKNEVMKYAEKATALERDVKIAPKVPDELDKFIYYFQQNKERNDKLSDEQTKGEFLRLAEKFFKRKLDDYISDVYTYGGDDMSGGGGSMSQYNIGGLIQQSNKKNNGQTVVDQLMDRF